jgi:hypothetical protein
MKTIIKRTEILSNNSNYKCFLIIQKHLQKIDKDLLWLANSLDQAQGNSIHRQLWHQYLYGKEPFSIQSIIIISKFLRISGCKIITPKQFIPDEYFSLSIRSYGLLNNIRYLMTITDTSLKEIAVETGIDKGNLSLLVRNKVGTSLKNINLIYRFFKLIKGLEIFTPLDILYFKEWGETEFSYLKSRTLYNRNFKVNKKTLALTEKRVFVFTDEITLSSKQG